jgi:hypothetical protein
VTRARSIEPRDPGVLPRPDYLDALEVAGRDRTAEDWARATFEGAPFARLLRLGWRYGLWLRLGPYPAAGHVLGWPILETAPDRLVLGVDSAVLGPCRLVFAAGSGRLLVNTVIRFEHPAARPVWTVVSPVHRLITRLLLARAAR